MLKELDMLNCAWLSQGAKVMTHDLDGAFDFASISLSTHALQADRREHAGVAVEESFEHNEGSAKESSREVTTKFHWAKPVLAGSTRSSRIANKITEVKPPAPRLQIGRIVVIALKHATTM